MVVMLDQPMRVPRPIRVEALTMGEADAEQLGAHQIGAKRVQRLGPVEADDPDSVLDFGLDVFVGGHVSLPQHCLGM